MSRKRALRYGLFAVLVSMQAPVAFADVKPHALITDGMALQEGGKVPIWGSADVDEKVTVHFQDQEISTIAKDGTWMVRLDELKAGGPYEMTIAGKNRIRLKNILIGEVWICSGQSNMEWPLQMSADANKMVANSANPLIHLFTVPRTAAAVPLHHVQGKWQECGPDTVKSFSAVGYFFGRDVQKARNVPVGLIHSSWGGTPAEAWTSKAALGSEPALKYLSDRQTNALAAYPKVMDKYIAALGKYEEAFAKAVALDQDPPAPPAALQLPPSRNPHGASTLYNGMIASIIPYAIRGAIWYQGESNASRAYEYRTLLPAMIKNWRTD
jgi:sialate O-acetylesterase